MHLSVRTALNLINIIAVSSQIVAWAKLLVCLARLFLLRRNAKYYYSDNMLRTETVFLSAEI